MKERHLRNETHNRGTQPVALATGLALSALGIGCGPQNLGSLPGTQDKVTASRAEALVGADGALTIAVANTVINDYSKLTVDAAKGSTTLTVASAAGLNLNAGDLVMVIQMQGAEIDTTDDPVKYGNITKLNNAGNWEIAGVSAVNNGMNKITLDGCGGLKNNYTTAGHAQVVRVPQYTNLTVALTGSITADPWDGDKGGVIAAYVRNKTILSGDIDASGKGFRGGSIVGDNQSQAQGTKVTTMRSTTAADGAERGEGIVGYQTEYDALQGRYGRGAAGNAGGGGDSHNGGGGGGANGKNAKDWTGAGVMDPNVVGGAKAWTLDPDYVANGNKLTDSAGGGRGGYSFASADQDATTVKPGDTSWGGNNRENAGGFGGRPLDSSPSGRLFLGGGGGAGDGNNGAAGNGGAGGGLIYLVTGQLEGGATVVGNLKSNGAPGANTKAGTTGNDAPGGGGGGGTIVALSGRLLSGSKLNADGGDGGNQNIATAESEGPGGGGGGGYVSWFAAQTLLSTRSTAGGVSGTSTSTGVTEFPVNGATKGAAGSPNNQLRFVDGPTLPVCVPSDLSVTTSLTGGMVTAGSNATITVVVGNAGPNPADVVGISDTISPGTGLITWTCAAAGGATCPALLGTGNINGVGSIPMSGTLTYTLTVPIPQNFRGGVLNYTANAAIAPGFNDGNLTNNSSTLPLPFPSADLSLAMTNSPNPATPGMPEAYTLTVTNNGAGTAGGTTLTFDIPQGGALGSIVPGTGWTCTATQTQVSCDYNLAIPPGAIPPVQINIVPLQSGGTLDTTATATTNGATDPDTTNNTVTSSTPINTAPGSDISVAINSTPNPAPTGSAITYSVRVANVGMIPAGGASLRYDAPAGSTIQSVNAPTGWMCQTSGLTVDCSYLQPVPTGALPVVSIVVQPDAAATSATATASALGIGIADTNLSNNVATEVTPIGAAPDADLYVRVTTMPNPPARGMPIMYTVDVANRGPGTATGAVFDFKVPAGSTVQKIDASAGWSCGEQNAVVECWYSGNIDPNSDTPDVIITILPDPTTTELNTEVSVTPKGANDPNPGDNTTTGTISLDSFKLVGGGFAPGCNAAPGGIDPSVTGGFLASLLGLLGLRRRRRS